MNTELMFSSKTDLWSTPPELFKALDDEFTFTLDPCCTVDNATCPTYFTEEDDGLSKSWAGHTVFMNPPYGREIGKWIKKAYEEDATVVCLIPSRTDTKWWHDYVMQGEVRFIKGRLKFGGHKNPAPFPSAVIIFRSSKDE